MIIIVGVSDCQVLGLSYPCEEFVTLVLVRLIPGRWTLILIQSRRQIHPTIILRILLTNAVRSISVHSNQSCKWGSGPSSIHIGVQMSFASSVATVWLTPQICVRFRLVSPIVLVKRMASVLIIEQRILSMICFSPLFNFLFLLGHLFFAQTKPFCDCDCASPGHIYQLSSSIFVLD